jgi:hypothetical protein
MKSFIEHIGSPKGPFEEEEIIQELADAPFTWHKISGMGNEYEFENSKGEKYIVSFKAEAPTPKRNLRFGLSFSHVQDHPEYGEMRSMDITGTGEAVKVFSTVNAIITDFLGKYPDASISFAADKSEGKNSSRAKLYHVLAARLAKSKGMELIKKDYGVVALFTVQSKKSKSHIKEDAPINNAGAGNIAGIGVGPHGEPGSPGFKFLRRKKPIIKEEEPSFSGHKVFDVSPEHFNNARLGKRKFHKFERYVGKNEVGEKIRQYGRQNPDHPIILRHKDTGAMMYLRYPKKTSHLYRPHK